MAIVEYFWKLLKLALVETAVVESALSGDPVYILRAVNFQKNLPCVSYLNMVWGRLWVDEKSYWKKEAFFESRLEPEYD